MGQTGAGIRSIIFVLCGVYAVKRRNISYFGHPICGFYRCDGVFCAVDVDHDVVDVAAAYFLAHSSGIEFQFQFMCGIGLGRVDFLLRQLVIGNGVKPFDTGGHIAIGNALNFQFMHAHKIGNLLKAHGRIIDQPTAVALAIMGLPVISSSNT